MVFSEHGPPCQTTFGSLRQVGLDIHLEQLQTEIVLHSSRGRQTKLYGLYFKAHLKQITLLLKKTKDNLQEANKDLLTAIAKPFSLPELVSGVKGDPGEVSEAR